jgi:hypothetical protein
MTTSNASDELNIRQESLDSDKVLVLVTMLQVLPRHLDFVKLQEAEFSQMSGLFEMPLGCSAIKLLFESVSPSA